MVDKEDIVRNRHFSYTMAQAYIFLAGKTLEGDSGLELGQLRNVRRQMGEARIKISKVDPVEDSAFNRHRNEVVRHYNRVAERLREAGVEVELLLRVD